MMKRLGAELIGTFWLVLGGCGSAVLAANFGGDGNPLGIGLLGVSLAFGLTVLTGAYALGHISGGHFNPAVSFGLWAGGRFAAKDLLPYIVAQVLGAGLLLTSPHGLGLSALVGLGNLQARLMRDAVFHARLHVLSVFARLGTCCSAIKSGHQFLANDPKTEMRNTISRTTKITPTTSCTLAILARGSTQPFVIAFVRRLCT